MKYVRSIGFVTLWVAFMGWCVGAIGGVVRYFMPEYHLSSSGIITSSTHFWYLIPAIILVPSIIIAVGIGLAHLDDLND